MSDINYFAPETPFHAGQRVRRTAGAQIGAGRCHEVGTVVRFYKGKVQVRWPRRNLRAGCVVTSHLPSSLTAVENGVPG